MEILKYRKDANSPWQEIVALVGPQGPEGKQGPQGKVGPQGPTGPQGDSYVLTEGDKRDIASYVELSNYATQSYVNNKIAQIPEPDLSNYYTKTQTDTRIANAISAIPEVDLSKYATEDFVQTKIAEAKLDGSNIDLSNYYTKNQVDALIPDTSGFALKTEIPDTSGFTTMSAVEAKGYQTEAQVLALITANIPASGDEVSY